MVGLPYGSWLLLNNTNHHFHLFLGARETGLRCTLFMVGYMGVQVQEPIALVIVIAMVLRTYFGWGFGGVEVWL